MIRFYILTIVVTGILAYLIQPRKVEKPMYVKKFNTIAYMKYDSTAVIILDTATVQNVFVYLIAKKNEKGDLIYLSVPADLFY